MNEAAMSQKQKLSYFMVRVRAPSRDTEAVSGNVERLGSGVQEAFQSPEDLLRILGFEGEPRGGTE